MHGNFARAAEELSLTEGAISRQIARTESLLNCKLFERTGSRVRLNPNGARYAHHVRETLERLERDTQYLMGLRTAAEARNRRAADLCQPLAHSPTGDFQRRNPDITLNIAVRTDPFILTGSGFDAAVHFEHPAWAGMRLRFLFEERLVPVCHAGLLTGEDPPAS